jgi:hypothetical protein
MVRHPDFATKVRAIAVEFASTTEQSTLDRYIRGENVSRDVPQKTGFETQLLASLRFRASADLIHVESRAGQAERSHRHANGNGRCGSAHPIEHHPPPHLGSDLIVRLTSAVINHKADDGRPEI